jgi:hypothetical protein
MGLLDQIFAGVGGAASGAAEGMNVTAELQRRREALAAQRETDMSERLYRQDQLARQEARDEQLRIASERTAQQQAARDAARQLREYEDALRREERDSAELERRAKADARAEAYLRVAQQNANRVGNGNAPKLTDNLPFAAMNDRQDRAREEIVANNNTLTRMGPRGEVPASDTAEYNRVLGRNSQLQREVEARGDSLDLFGARLSGTPVAPRPAAGTTPPSPDRDPRMTAYLAAAARIKAVADKYPGNPRAQQKYREAMAALNNQYFPNTRSSP